MGGEDFILYLMGTILWDITKNYCIPCETCYGQFSTAKIWKWEYNRETNCHSFLASFNQTYAYFMWGGHIVCGGHVGYTYCTNLFIYPPWRSIVIVKRINSKWTMGNRYEGSVKARDYELCLLTVFKAYYFIINKFICY